MQIAKDKKKLGLLLAIDFEKAYDSVSFSFIKKTLEFFNFGPKIIGWVSLLLAEFSAVVAHCGNLSRKFQIGRGCRQGDPIASILFILAIEILSIKIRKTETIKGFKPNLGEMVQIRVQNLGGQNEDHVLREKKLEQFADDCTVFLEPDESSLRALFGVLTEFYNISGLKISASKTKAVWFGHGAENRPKICNDLNLQWDTTFKLLGITFTFNLEGMESNYTEKLEEIQKVFNCWAFRKITPYGKITIIKSLALSKLSYVALILPALGKKNLKKLEQSCQKFIWGNQKSVKVSKEDSALPEEIGGLGMLDINDFWDSLRFSWIRRAINSNDEWPKMLALTLSEILGQYVNISQFLELPLNKIRITASKITNPFWKQVLNLIDKFTKASIYCFPYRLLMFPFWENPFVLSESKPMCQNQFANLGKTLKYTFEFFNPKTGIRLSKRDLNIKFKTRLTDNKFAILKTSIDEALEKVGLNKDIKFTYEMPIRPGILEIANISQKGTKPFYNLIRERYKTSNHIHLREAKWHKILGCTYGLQSWQNRYKRTKKIKFDNRLKFLAYQIARGSLYTNTRVAKFAQNVEKTCTFCGINPPQHQILQDETIPHLFFECDHVHNFWASVLAWLSSIDIHVDFNRNILLFGYEDQGANSPKNTILNTARAFIWKMRIKKVTPILAVFKHQLKYKIDIYSDSLAYANQNEEKLIWDEIKGKI